MAKVSSAIWPEQGQFGAVVPLAIGLENIKKASTLEVIVSEYSGIPPAEGGGSKLTPLQTFNIGIAPEQGGVELRWQIPQISDVNGGDSLPEFRFKARIQGRKSGSKSSKLLKIGNVKDLKWNVLEGNLLEQPEPGKLVQHIFSITKKTGLQADFVGLEGYFVDFSVLQRSVGDDGKVTYATLEVIKGIKVDENGSAKTEWAPQGIIAELFGTQYVFEIEFYAKEGGPRFKPSYNRSPIAQAAEEGVKLAGNPKEVFFGNFLPGGAPAFAFLTKGRKGENGNPATKTALQLVSADGKEVLYSVVFDGDKAQNAPTQIVAVANLDGGKDGQLDIVALYGGDSANQNAVLYVYRAMISAKGKKKLKQFLGAVMPKFFTLGNNCVKLFPDGKGYSIMVAPNCSEPSIFTKDFKSVNILIYRGSAMKNVNPIPETIEVKVEENPDLANRQVLSFPTIIVGKDFVTVIAKSRILVFDLASLAFGQPKKDFKFYQFVDNDKDATFTDNEAESDLKINLEEGIDFKNDPDKFPAIPFRPAKYQGRRYGIYLDEARDEKGTPCLFVAGENTNESDPQYQSTVKAQLAGGVYETYNLGLNQSTPKERVDYIPRNNNNRQIGLRNSSASLMFQKDSDGAPTKLMGEQISLLKIPANYRLGTSLRGFVLSDRRYLLVTEERVTRGTSSKTLDGERLMLINPDGNSRESQVINPGVSGLLVDVIKLDKSSDYYVVLFYKDERRHYICKMSPSSTGKNKPFIFSPPVLLPGDLGATIMNQFEYPDMFQPEQLLQIPPGLAHSGGHFSVQLALDENKQVTFVADALAGSDGEFLVNPITQRLEFPEGAVKVIKSWKLGANGAVVPSLTGVNQRPGRVVGTVIVDGATVWALELEADGKIDEVAFFVQQGEELVPWMPKTEPVPTA